MGVRDLALEGLGAVFATFLIKQTAGVDDLKEVDIGKAVIITAGNTVGPAADGSVLLRKLVDLSLTDADGGKRVATVQIGGIVNLNLATPAPLVGNRVVGGASGTVKQARALGASDPAGGNIARGTVIAVNGTTDCTLILN